MKTSRALKASRSLREGFAKASRRLQPYPRRLLEGFAKAPRAPPFGNDSSDNDKPPEKVSEVIDHDDPYSLSCLRDCNKDESRG